MVKALIVDDEAKARNVLQHYLANFVPEVTEVRQADSVNNALDILQVYQPDIVFLDVEMPHKNGFQFLTEIKEPGFDVIFTTAYNQYAIQAIRFSALDYLVKPIDTVDLIAAVRRAENTARINPQQLELMRQYYPSGSPGVKGPSNPGRIALPHASGMVFVDTKQIIYCEADSNYTRFYLENGEQYMVSKTLGDVQDVLETRDFVRVHRQYMVNLEHIQKLVKGEGTYLLLTSGASIPVARQQKDRLMERFGWL